MTRLSEQERLKRILLPLARGDVRIIHQAINEARAERPRGSALNDEDVAARIIRMRDARKSARSRAVASR